MDRPTHFGRYAVVRRVGSGGFATVWLARDEELDAEVAIKLLSENWLDDEDVRRRFVAEGRFLRRVESPHVIGVHDIGETTDGRPFLVLTYADGGTLADRIKAGPLDVATAVDVVGQVGTGLQQLHARGVLHRDVKPANVLFRTTAEGEVAMLGDLGLGKALDAVSRVTLPGGTPAYVAPEQAMGEQLDPRADLYSLGAVTYAALTGNAPHGAKSLGAVLQIDAPPPSIRTLRPEVSRWVDEVVCRALDRDRDLRWPDVAAFTAALREALAAGDVRPAGLAALPSRTAQSPAGPGADDPTETFATPPATPAAAGGGTGGTEPVRRPRRRAWVVAALLAAVLGAAGGYGGFRYVEQRPVTVSDSTAQVSVTVPRAWAVQRSSGWTPQPTAGEQPGLLVSRDNAAWARPDSSHPGVFVGVRPIAALPTSLPAHPECTGETQSIRADTVDGQDARTQEFLACPGGTVMIERVLKLSDARLLRVQVRAADAEQAVAVLDSADFRPNT